MWLKLLLVLMAGFFVWQTWRFLQYNPDALSEGNVKRGLPVLGWVALFLAVVLVVAYLVLGYYG